MQQKVRTVEAVVAEIARRSHGVVTRSELVGAGITPEEIRRRIERGALLPVHRGVYRVGHLAPSLEAVYLAAVKACGSGALLAGRAAAHLWSLIKRSPPPPEVLAPGERRVPGVRVHRARRPELDRDAARRLGIPITTVPRTLVDLAAVLTEAGLARACHEAGVLHRTTPAQVNAVLERRPTSLGASTLRRVLYGEVPVTLSRLESHFLERLEEAGLPLPETNRRAGGRRVDCRWPTEQLTVELDGYRYHSSRHAWERDRRREREARARGDEFRRYSYGDVFEDADLMLAELRALLLPGLP
jgi:hypothetical protein